MTTSSRNPGVRKLVEQDGEEATKEFIRGYYGIPDSVTSWKDLDDAAEMKQRQMNEQTRVQRMNK